jgi:dihydrofolate reductase
MRKLIVTNIVSLDGYYEGPGGNVMALPMDASFDSYNAERLGAADTLLLGATTYTGFKGFWPGVADMPGASAAHLEISRRDSEIDKVVVSDSLTEADTDPWTDTTTIVRRADSHAAIADLKRAPGRDILVFGSRTLWNDLLTADLVDELHLIVGAVVLGDGTPAFGSQLPSSLKLLGSRSLDGSDNLLVRYAVGQ